MGVLVQNGLGGVEVEGAVATALQLALAVDDAQTGWLDLVSDAVLLLDPVTLAVTRANASAREQLSGGLDGDPVDALVAPVDQPILRAALRSLVADARGEIGSVRCQLRSEGGWRTFWLGAGVLAGGTGLGTPRLLCLLRPTRPAPADTPPRLRLVRGGALLRDLDRLEIDAAPWTLQVSTGLLDAPPLWEGQRRPEALDDWFEQLHEDDRARVRLDLITHLRGLSDRLESEYRMKRRVDGSERWVRLQGRLEAGEQLVGNQRDVTGEKGIEAALARSEARFRQLLERSPDAVLVHRGGRLVHVNRALLSVLGWTRESELLGEPLLKYVHSDDVEALCERVLSVRGGGDEEHPPLELRMLQRDGGAVVVETVSLQLDFDGRSATLTLVRDLSARRKLQARMAHADRMVSLGTLAAGVAHEINNPLTFMQINLTSVAAELPALLERLQRLEGGAPTAADDEDDLKQRMDEILIGAQRIREIVSDLKTFTHSDDEPPGSVDLRQALELALNLARHEIKYRAKVSASLGSGLRVRGHEGRLCQVFLNLLVNAAQAIEIGEVSENEIRVTALQEGDYVSVQVTDTGAGIPAQDLERLFEPFFTTKAPGVGSGLGLSICRHIVEDYGGEIAIDSEPGRGTRVTVRLALADPDIVGEIPAEPDQEPAPAPASEALARVLLIDDEPELCRSVRRALKGEYEVVIATTGQQAKALLSGDSRGFDAVICDVMMPEVTGMDMLEWVKLSRPELADQVVFMTGGAVGERARRFVDEVDNFVVEKPIDIRNMRRLLRRIVSTSRPASSSERRQGRRFPGRGIHGLLEVAERVWQVELVDYSESGVRLRGRNLGALSRVQAPVTVILRGGGEPAFVRAKLSYVRDISASPLVDVCFQLSDMEPPSRSLYQSWLEHSAQASPAQA